MRSMLATKDWILVNGMEEEVVKGGPFTRKDPASGKLSCLDLFVISKELRPFVSSLIIDSKRASVDLPGPLQLPANFRKPAKKTNKM